MVKHIFLDAPLSCSCFIPWRATALLSAVRGAYEEAIKGAGQRLPEFPIKHIEHVPNEKLGSRKRSYGVSQPSIVYEWMPI